MTYPMPDPGPVLPDPGPVLPDPRRRSAWPATAAPAMPPAPWTLDLDTVTRLSTPRPGTAETTGEQACGWCHVRIDQGAHHTRPVHHTPDGHDEPTIYGSAYCAAMDDQGIPHLGTLPRLVAPAPAGWSQ